MALQVLAQLGANIETPNKNGATPVYVAAAFGYTETVKLLARLGANLDKRDNFGGTPLFAASSIAIEKIKQKKNLPRLTWRQNVISRERPKLKCSQSEVTL